jgi:hypothetical protein
MASTCKRRLLRRPVPLILAHTCTSRSFEHLHPLSYSTVTGGTARSILVLGRMLQVDAANDVQHTGFAFIQRRAKASWVLKDGCVGCGPLQRALLEPCICHPRGMLSLEEYRLVQRLNVSGVRRYLHDNDMLIEEVSSPFGLIMCELTLSSTIVPQVSRLPWCELDNRGKE